MPNQAQNARSLPATPIRRIVLTGFMGSGKSTIGPRLARRLGWRFLDSDEVIEREAQRTIAAIFASEGEPAFRATERETIARLAAEDGLVLSLGGGAIESPETRRLLTTTPETLLVHLEITLETSLERCAGTDGSRPVLADRANLAARYQRRLPLYREARLTVACDRLKPREIVERIIAAANLNIS